MADLQSYKTPIFTGINDAPIAPTATKGGNGSDLIARINNLIDALSVPVPTEVHNYDEQYLFVNASTGSDDNDGMNEPLRTIKAALAIVAKKKINGYFSINLDGDFAEPLDFRDLTAINSYGQPSVLELNPGNNIEAILTLGGTYAIIPSLSPFLEVIIKPNRWVINDQIALAEVKRPMTIRGILNNNIPADAGQNALFTLWNSRVNFEYCQFNTAGSNISLFEARESQVSIKGGDFQGFTDADVGNCNNCKVWLKDNVTGAGNTRSLSLREGTILSTKNYTFESGTYDKDQTSYITTMAEPVLPPPA